MEDRLRFVEQEIVKYKVWFIGLSIAATILISLGIFQYFNINNVFNAVNKAEDVARKAMGDIEEAKTMALDELNDQRFMWREITEDEGEFNVFYDYRLILATTSSKYTEYSYSAIKIAADELWFWEDRYDPDEYYRLERSNPKVVITRENKPWRCRLFARRLVKKSN